jgi:hypothetical protein
MSLIVSRKDQFIIIVWTTFLAGTLDINAAFINSYLRSEVTPDIVLQYIASGVLSQGAFSGGLGTAFLGLLIHYLITFTWTFIFFKLYPLLGIKSKYQIFTGLIYGILIWLVMNLVVLPNSGVRQLPFQVPQAILGISFIMFLIGLPISLMFHKFSSYSLKNRNVN